MSQGTGRPLINTGTSCPDHTVRTHSGANSPLSVDQMRQCVLHSAYAERRQIHHICVRVRLTGPLREESLHGAWSYVIARHVILRAAFQSMDSYTIEPLETVPLSAVSDKVRSESLESIVRAAEDEPFDLARAPLVRLNLLSVSDSEYILSLVAHPLVADLRSLELILEELIELYSAVCHDAVPEQVPDRITYCDFVSEQQNLLRSDALGEDIEYWRRYLKGPLPILDLPTDYPRPPVQSFRMGRMLFSLGKEYTERLNTCSRNCGVSQAAILCASWALCLSRLAGQDELIIGMPSDYRDSMAPKHMVGPLENGVALRIQVNPDQSLSGFLAQVTRLIAEATAHQKVPFQRIINSLGLSMDSTRHPVFQTQFRVKSLSNDELRVMGLTASIEEYRGDPPLFDLSLSAVLAQDSLRGCVSYDANLFNATTVKNWAHYLEHVLRKMLSVSPEQGVGGIALLTSDERRKVLYEFNDTCKSYPGERLVHELFEAHAESSPDAVAIVDGQCSLTYAKLMDVATRLAGALASHGVSFGDCVPLLMPRSLEMICAQLAVLKCGAAYLPLDPTISRDRRTFVCKDSEARLGICHRMDLSDAHDGVLQWVDHGAMLSASLGTSKERSLRIPQPTDSPAYVMYTSGSTGIPKGVVVPHRAIVRLVINCGYLTVDVEDRIAHCSNPSFDASTFEVWSALLNGGCIVVVPPRVVLEPRLLSETIKGSQITAMILTTALFNQQAASAPHTFVGLRSLLFGGEAADAHIVRGLLQGQYGVQLVNVYGPTETTTFATSFSVESLAGGASNVPIGRPISNTHIYVLDKNLQPMPLGAVGEIYIGGPGVSLGYMNRPALTADRFIADPFSGVAGARLYRSGDLGRWLTDGTVEYRGRNDQQVKIRGFRIELGEIEVQISADPAVREVAVLAREDVGGEKLLVAYIVPVGGENRMLELDCLRKILRDALPEYMVPAAFVVLPEFPLTGNGKLDRRALPLPTASDYQGAQYEPPLGVVEEYLCEVWQELLGVARVGRRDNFFHVGGNSIQGMKLSVRLAERFNVRIPTHAVFQAQVLYEMAELVEQARRAAPPQSAVCMELEFDADET